MKRVNIQAFKFVPVERLHLKIVMNQCVFEYSYGKPVGTAIKKILGAFVFVLILINAPQDNLWALAGLPSWKHRHGARKVSRKAQSRNGSQLQAPQLPEQQPPKLPR